MKVVLVEHSHTLRERLVSGVSEIPGIQVVAAPCGVEETLAAVDRTCPDLVVLDVRLEDGSGFEVMRVLRSRPQRPAIMMLALFPTSAVRRHFRALGGEYFFDKASQINDAFAFLGALARQSKAGRGESDDARAQRH